MKSFSRVESEHGLSLFKLAVITSLLLGLSIAEAFQDIGPNNRKVIGRVAISEDGLVSGFALDQDQLGKNLKYQIWVGGRKKSAGGVRLVNRNTNIKLPEIDDIYGSSNKAGFEYQLPAAHIDKSVHVRVLDHDGKGWNWLFGSGAVRLQKPHFSIADISESSCAGKMEPLRADLLNHMNGLAGTDIEFKIGIIFNKLGYGGNIHTGVTAQEYIDRQPKWGGSSSNSQIADAVVDLAINGLHSAHQLPAGAEAKIGQLIPSYADSHQRINTINLSYHNQIDYLKSKNTSGQHAAEILRLTQARSDWQEGLKEEIAQSAVAHALAGDLNSGQVLTEFWFNHFNVNSDKTYNHTYDYERQIRKRVCGTFLDLLRLSVTHPAMLLYLDQRSNVMDGTSSSMISGEGVGVNENYSRELLELHTLGAGPKSLSEPNSPYDQTDVTRLARLLTGWSYTVGYGVKPYFNFDASVHDSSRAAIMGQVFSQGIAGGEEFLRYIASHPQTKKNICTKLATEFHNERDVKTSVDPWLVQKCINGWGQEGNLTAMYRAVMGHWRFLNYTNHNTDIKSPLEVVVTGSRQVGYDLDHIPSGDHLHRLARASKDLGIHPRRVGPPTGYPLGDSAWLNSNFLSHAQNFAFHFADHLVSAYVDGVNYTGAALEDKINMVAQRDGATQALDKVRFGALQVKPRYYGLSHGADQLAESVLNPDRNHPQYNPLPVRTINSLILGSREFLLK